MKCPLLTMVAYPITEPMSHEDRDCLKEECAWWLEDIQLCSVKDLALELRYTQLGLSDIRDKMPHEEQFRK